MGFWQYGGNDALWADIHDTCVSSYSLVNCVFNSKQQEVKMKLLMFHAKEFLYKPYSSQKNTVESHSITNSIVAFIHVEEGDKERKEEITDKAAGNLKWLANKNKTEKITLHSFAHLSNSKSDPETANNIIQETGEKLKSKLTVHIVPFGQFYEFSIHVLGQSLAKVFKDL